MRDASGLVPPVIETAEAVQGIGRPRTRAGDALLLFGAAACALVVVCWAAKFCLATGLSWRCPVMAVLHVPCPSCGSTRAFAALSELRFLDAWRFNPLMIS